MKDKILEWLEFHGNILERHSTPYFIWTLGAVLTLLEVYLYPKFVMTLFDYRIFQVYPLRSLINDNLDILEYVYWVITTAIALLFWWIGIEVHKKNIRKLFG